MVVIVLIGVIGSIAFSRVESILLFKQKEQLRKFANNWEFLFQHALARNETYRLVLNLDNNTFHVEKEVQIKGDQTVEVDYLANLRTSGEKARRAADALEEQRISAEELTAIEDSQSTGDLSEQYFAMVFSDSNGAVKTAPPLEFPELADPQALIEGVQFKDVKIGGEAIETGTTFIRFSPRGASQFALVHFLIEDSDFTLFMNPSSGKVVVENTYKDYEWTYGKLPGS